jgi:hypothetical protein
MKPEIISLLKQAAEHFKSARKSLIEGAGLLHKISNERLYLGKFDSFGEYLEQECQLSEGTASKLIKVYQHFVIDGGVSPRNLQNVDSEKLYLALRLDMKPSEQLTRAETWSREDLREEVRAIGKDEHECKMDMTVVIHPCKTCGRLLRHE